MLLPEGPSVCLLLSMGGGEGRRVAFVHDTTKITYLLIGPWVSLNRQLDYLSQKGGRE